VSAVQLADSVRYGVQLLPLGPDGMLSDVRVEVTLPAGADLVEALETPPYTQFQGREGDRLSWAASFVANDYLDVFSFRLRQVASGPLTVQARWGGSAPGEATVTTQPSIELARASEGEVTLDSAGTPTLLAAGETGVYVGIAAGVVAQPTRVQVRRLGPDLNPPATVGDLWWCAAVELSGLPDGARALVSLPTRQVLPQGTPVALFARRGEQWEELPDKGITGADGQSVLFVHPGGTVAAGTSGAVQARPASGGASVAATPTPRPGQTTTTNVGLAPRTGNLTPNLASVTQAINQLPPGGGGTQVVPFSQTTNTMAQPGSCNGRPLCENANPQCTPAVLDSGARCTNSGGGHYDLPAPRSRHLRWRYTRRSRADQPLPIYLCATSDVH
jgi:hypothetical protein